MCDSNGAHETCACDTQVSSGSAHSHDRAGHHNQHGHAHEHGSAPVVFSYGVQGMTCAHCVSSVTKELHQLDGVTNVDIDLVAGGVSRVTVGSSRVLDDNEVAAAVDEAGYELADLPR